MTSAGFVAHPETWAGAGKKVGDASSSLAGVTNQLCRVLGDNWGAWGKDDIGEAFGNGADGKPGFGQAADNLLMALAQMVNLLAQTGWGMQVSGAIYVAADVASTIGAQPTQGPWRIPQPAAYKLPAVSRELVPSDSPPPMWMDILGLMSSMVVGCQYPDGSFGALGDISAELKAAANGITTIAETVQRAAGSVTSSNSGLAADTFATHARSTVSGLGWLAWQCKALASSADNLLAQKHAARIQFWASLAFLAVMFAAAQALAIFTFGASEGGFLAAVVGQGLGLRALLIFVLRMVIEGMMFSAGDDVIEQFARMHEHLQDGFSEGQFVKSAGTGALASLVTFGLARGVYLGAGSSQALKTVVTWMENDATASLSARARGVFTRVAVNTVAGTGGNVAAQAAVDQQVDLKGAVGSALSMGIIGEGTEAGTRAAIRYRISRVNADHTGSEDGTAAAGASSSAAPARPISVRAALASTVHDSGSGDTTQLAPQPSPADQPTALTGIEGPATAAVHAAMTSPATGTAADTAGGYRTPVRTVVTADVHPEPVSVTATVGGHGGPLAAEAPAGDHTDAVPGAAPAGARADASAADAGLASAQPPRPAATSVADHPGATGPDSHAAPATYDAVQAGAVGASGREVTTVSGAADPSGASGWRDDAAGIPAAGTQQPASSAGRPDLTGRPDLSGPDLAGRAGDQAVSTGRPGDAPTPDEALPAGLAPAAEVQATPSHLDWADRPNRGIVDVPDPEPAAYANTETAVSTAMAAFPAETSDMVTLNKDGTATVWLHETTAAHWSHEHMATVAEPTGRVIGLRMSRDLPAGNDDPADPEGALLAGLVRKAAAATAPLRTPSDGDLGSTRADAELLAQLTGKTARAIQGGRIAPGLADEVVGGWQRALDEGRPVILSSRDGPAQITDITDGLITVRAPDGSIEHIPAAAARDRLTGDYATVLEPLHPALPRPDPARADANEDAARSGQAAAGTHDGPAEDGQQPSLVAVAPERVQVSETVRIKIRNPELTYGAKKLGWRWGKALLDGKELPLMPDEGKVNPYQLHQGAEGDCGYLSIALEVLRYLDKHDPQAIEEMFVHYQDEGKVIARIYDSKITWYGTREWLVSEPTGRLYELEMTDEVVIQPDSADPGRPAFVDVRQARALFVGMMEKAIAAADQTPTLFRPEDRKQGSGHGAGDTGYKLLDGSGGADWPAVLTMFTGRRARTFSDAETKDPVAFMQTVQAVRQADLPVIAGTRGSYGAATRSAKAEEPPWNLYWGHAYGVASVESKLHGGVDGGYLNAHNPHGGSDRAGTRGYTEPISASENPWEAAVRRLQGGTDGEHPNTPSPQRGSDVNVRKGFPEPVPINKDLWKVFNKEHWAALDFGTDPVTTENHALDAALRAGGAADLTPAPEVTETARHALRAGETAAAGPGERPVPDASRVARNLAGILQAPAPDGAALLARLHEAGGDPVTAQRVRAAYAGLTGRDLAADVRQADLGFDPGGPVARLLPDGSTTVPAASGDSVRSPGFTAALHDAVGSRDAMTASALLDQAGGKPRELWSLDDRYRESYGTGVRDHISAAFGESADGRYLRYLAGDDRLAAPAASPAEAWDMFGRLQQSTFTTSDGFEEPVPFGNHTEGAADRAHRMALALTEWGHRPGKIFAIRNNLDLHPETPYKPLNRLVPADISYNAAPVIKVTGDDGRDLDIVLDPAAADRPLTVDEWLGHMGVTRDGYLRFDASGLDDPARADIEGTLTDFFFKRAQGRLYSNRALVYTTDPGTYYPFATAGQLGLGQHLGEEALRDVEGNYGIPGTRDIVRRADIDFARLKQDYPFRSPSLRDADRQSVSAQNSLEGTIYRDAAERLRLRLWDIMKSGATGQDAADQAVRALNEDPRLAILRRDLESGHSLPSSVTQYVDGSSYRQVQALARLAEDINDRFRRG